ncbi:hypothetical protein [Alienimonas californiensis]|uniref:Transposase IS200 like protein n=1 Tax=Alienimonas californiensis TaxID=2527989 RepID=A0A517PF79_9PLAN|nr:hypothetical protein [Alienimonas californiensis]QDT18028.1 hypothetical protein CA12_41660 [Alienimonas californiensis]
MSPLPASEQPARWWLVTFNTHGTWLPGDPRGFQTWRGRLHVPPPQRYAKPGEATYDPAPHRLRHAAAQRIMKGDPVHLTPKQQGCCLEAMVEEFDVIGVKPSILALNDWHVHTLIRVGGYPIRTAVGRLKAAASRLLSQYEIKPDKVWAQGCHMKSKDDDGAVLAAFQYVRNHESEGALVHTWFHPLGGDVESKPR